MLTGVHVNALWKCNVDDLDILQGAVVKIITSYPGEEDKSINKLNVDSQSVVGSVFEQDALQGSGWKRTVCQVSNLSGTNQKRPQRGLLKL